MTATAPEVVPAGPKLAWRAVARGADVGVVRAVVRPDERCFLFFNSCRDEAYVSLVAAVAEDVRRDLYVTVDEGAAEALGRYERLGFVFNRREIEYRIPTDFGLTRLGAPEPPHRITFRSAAGVDEDRLRVLDDVLRQDVPGTDGWRWDPAGFRAETFASRAFDPATYLVAIDERRGEYVGIARVWINPRLPRLGFIGVRRQYRRRGLAKAMLAHVFRVLDERGVRDVTTEVDDTNVASTALIVGAGACRTGSSVELVRPLERQALRREFRAEARRRARR